MLISNHLIGFGAISELSLSPGDLGATCWYRSDSITTSGSSVTAWPDQSGNGYHLDGVRNSPQVSGTLGGHDVIVCTSDALYRVTGNEPTIALASGIHVWGVFRPDAFTSSARLYTLEDTDGSSSRPNAIGNGSDNIIPRLEGSGAVPGGTAPSAGGWGFWDAVYLTTAVKAAWGGAAFTSQAGSFSTGASGISVAGEAVGANYLNCAFTEFAVFTGELSADNRAALMAYGRGRYGLP